MDWFQWIIPIVLVTVWILKNLMKVQEDARNQPPRLPPRIPRPEDEAARPRKDPGEMDRFLEEVRRRQQAAEQGKRTSPTVPAESRSKPVPPPLPKLKKKVLPKSLQREFKSAEEALQEAFRVYGFDVPEDVEIYYKGPTGNLRKLSRQEVRERFFSKQSQAESILVAQPVELVELAHQTPPPVPVVSSQKSSQSFLNLQGMLRNRQSLATAILLREILEPPLCKRHQRR